MKEFLRELKVATIALTLIFTAIWFNPKYLIVQNYALGQTTNYATSTDGLPFVPVNIKAEQIKAKQDALLDKLSLGCEVKGSKEPDGVLLLDSNNQMSIGRFQFQITTVQHYVKKFEGKSISRHDAIVLALDSTEAKELARQIVFKDNGLNNWYNCTVAHQLQSERDAIIKLMK